MTLQELESKIKSISVQFKIEEKEVISRIEAYLDVQFSVKDYSDDDKKIIEGIKEKIMSTLYDSEGQKIRTIGTTKYNLLFDLDAVEMKLLDDTFKELYTDGFINTEYDEIFMTESGVREYRKNK